MTMATILRTASFRLWQKFTKALPFGPILPNMIPVKIYRTILKIKVKAFSFLMRNSTWRQKVHIRIQIRVMQTFTHGGRKDYNSKDIHSIACSFPSTYEHIRRWSQVKSEVLDVSSIIILDTIDECSPCGGLWLGLAHRWLGFHNVLATCSILFPGNRNKSSKFKSQKSQCVCKRCVISAGLTCWNVAWTRLDGNMLLQGKDTHLLKHSQRMVKIPYCK